MKIKIGLLALLLVAAISPAIAQVIVNPGGSGGSGSGCIMADPTATIGANVVPGVASSCMRSDAAPPLPSTLPALNGSALTALNASALASGTTATARGGLGLDASASTGVPVLAAGTTTITATTGTGNVVRATAPALVTPALGTIASGDGNALTNLNASNLGSGTLPAGRFPALTGDVTTVAGALASTLATVNSNVGSYGSSTNCPTFTVNAKGLVTAASQTSCSGNVAGPGSSVSGNVTTFSGATGKIIQDSGVALTALAYNGTGSVITSDPTITADNFNKECKLYTVNGSGITFNMPSATTLQPNGGCIVINNPSVNTTSLQPNGSDTANGGSAGAPVTLPGRSLTYVTTDGGTGIFAGAGTTAPALANISGLGSNVGTFLATPTSANLAAALTNETGTGAAVFAGSPTLTGTVAAAALTLSGNLTTNVTGTANNCLQADAAGLVTGTGSACGGGGGGSAPGGSNGNIQYRVDSTTFGGISTFNVAAGGQLTNSANSIASTPAQLWSGVPYVAGTGSTNLPMVFINSTGSTLGSNWTAGYFGINTGACNSACTITEMRVNGTATAAFQVMGNGEIRTGANIIANSTSGSIIAGPSGALTFNTRTSYITSPSNALIQLGGASGVSPVAQMLGVQNGVGTNQAGADFTIRGSLGSGSANSASIIFSVGGAVSGSGTTAATAAEVFRAEGVTQTLKIASGKKLQLGNTYVVTPTVATGYLVLTDAAGNDYKVNACLASGC